MALSKSVKTQRALNAPYRTRKFPVAADITFHAGEFVMVGGDDNVAKIMSGSSVAGNQFVGIVERQQDLKAGEYVEVCQGAFACSGSGFTVNDVNKIAYASDSTELSLAWTEGDLPVGRYAFADDTTFGKNAIFELGLVTSGSTI